MKSIPVRKIAGDDTRSANDGLKIRSLEALLNGQDLHHALHRHNYYYLLLIEKGTGVHEIDFTPYPLQSNRIFFLRPGQVHQLTVKAGSTGYIIQFSDVFIRELNSSHKQKLRSVFHCSCNDLSEAQAAQLKSIFALMVSEFDRKEELYSEIIRSHLMTAVLLLFRAIESVRTTHEKKSFSQEKLEEFQTLLEKKIVGHKKPADYAGMLHLSPYQLNSITKSLLGKNSSDVINEFLILEARRLLLATTNQVSQIADALGFADPGYFIRFFRKHTGMTPETLRKTSR